MIEHTQQRLFEIARDVLDLEDQLDHNSDPRSQGMLLMTLDNLKEHTRTLYDALVILRHELSTAQDSSEEPLIETGAMQEEPPSLALSSDIEAEPIVEPSTEKIKDIVAQMPPETHQVDELFQGIIQGSPEAHEALSHYQEEIEFEPLNQESESAATEADAHAAPVTPPPVEASSGDLNSTMPKPKSVNDQWGRLSIGLNDRTAFVQHLFLGDVDGFNRVLSQINTFETLDEVSDFLNDQVKQDYNNWEEKEAVAERFMRLIQQRFNA